MKTKTEIKSQAPKLSEEDRLALADEPWANLENPQAAPQHAPIPQWQKHLLDERLEQAKGDPGKPWEQVKAEVWPTGS
ncbi:MAG: addiction module protein [Acidobacteriota bacterium]